MPPPAGASVVLMYNGVEERGRPLWHKQEFARRCWHVYFGSTLGIWILVSAGGSEIPVYWRSDAVYIRPYLVIFIIIIIIIITCLFLGRGWGTSKHNYLVSCLLCWRRHVSTTVGHLQVTKMYIEENIFVTRRWPRFAETCRRQHNK